MNESMSHDDAHMSDEMFANAQPRRERADGEPPVVMIVDDDPGVVKALAKGCERLGAQIVTAHDGLQAILKAKRVFPDVLIVDINMPEVDGFRVCEWILNPQRPATEVIVVTGETGIEHAERCEGLGAFLVPKSPETWASVKAILCEILDLEEPEGRPSATLRLTPKSDDIALPVTGPRVLLVDDEPEIVQLLESRLRKLGATVFVAHNGLEAYRLAVREQPHLVITDYLMPEAGGHFLIWRLRDNPVTANIPIFIVSGQVETRERPLPRKDELLGPRGANRIFRKPVAFEDLLAAIRAECPMLRA